MSGSECESIDTHKVEQTCIVAFALLKSFLASHMLCNEVPLRFRIKLST